MSSHSSIARSEKAESQSALKREEAIKRIRVRIASTDFSLPFGDMMVGRKDIDSLLSSLSRAA